VIPCRPSDANGDITDHLEKGVPLTRGPLLLVVGSPRHEAIRIEEIDMPHVDAADAATKKSKSEIQEDRIIRSAVTELTEAGFTIAVHNGEHLSLAPSTDVRAVLTALRATDSDMLIADHPVQQNRGTLLLVYGNDPYEVIADYSISIEAHLQKALAIAREIEEMC